MGCRSDLDKQMIIDRLCIYEIYKNKITKGSSPDKIKMTCDNMIDIVKQLSNLEEIVPENLDQLLQNSQILLTEMQSTYQLIARRGTKLDKFDNFIYQRQREDLKGADYEGIKLTDTEIAQIFQGKFIVITKDDLKLLNCSAIPIEQKTEKKKEKKEKSNKKDKKKDKRKHYKNSDSSSSDTSRSNRHKNKKHKN